ncbi:MAG: leucine-rich repeat domain-containing protein [Oscillospiraceae bacterium]|nr:leucine-rich repeat domain-containing protein [Oscillospiraceae bacterium]
MLKKILFILSFITILFTSSALGAEVYGNLTYEIRGGYIEITGCNDTAAVEVNIPAEINGLPVTKISASAFQKNKNLRAITIPDSVTRVGAAAFEGTAYYNDASNWENGHSDEDALYIGSYLIDASVYSGYFEVKEGTTCLADFLFEYKALENIKLPDSLQSIGDGAFFGTHLRSIDIPANVEYIGEEAFRFCSFLTDINVSEHNSCYSSTDGVLFSGGMSELLIYPYEKQLTSYTVPDGVKGIRSEAFYDNRYITSVKLPESLKTVGSKAFYSCLSLAEITMSGVEYIDEEAFSGCGLKSVILPDSLRYIGANSFFHCSSLTTVKLNSGLETISESAFDSCILLTDISIPESVTEIGEHAFSYCVELKTADIKASIDRIPNYMFYLCYSLSDVTFSQSIKTIGESAFNSCKSLRDIPGEITYIEKSAFYSCDGLVNIRIPEGTAIINGGVFSSCANLESVYIPDSVIMLDDSAFYRCEKLKNIDGMKNVQYIGEEAFYFCDAIRSITVPECTQFIGKRAFGIGTAVFGVKGSAAEAWAGENDYYFLENGTEKTGGAISKTASWSLDLNTGLLEISGKGEMSSAPWRGIYKYISDIHIDEGITTIAPSAFSLCNMLTEIDLPDSIEYIYLDAFHGCVNLMSLKLPEKLIYIYDGAFRFCDRLSRIYIPSGVKNIGKEAFLDCYNLKDVYYASSQSAWKKIKIGERNSPLTDAEFHYMSTLPNTPLTPAIVNATASLSGESCKLDYDLVGIPYDAVIIAAFYYDDNRFEAITITSSSVIHDFSLSVEDAKNVEKIKLFAFKSLDSIQPLCPSAEVEIIKRR